MLFPIILTFLRLYHQCTKLKPLDLKHDAIQHSIFWTLKMQLRGVEKNSKSGHFIRSTVMHFYHLIFVILDASRMNEHIFEASKI